jgi:hypothetical protein
VSLWMRLRGWLCAPRLSAELGWPAHKLSIAPWRCVDRTAALVLVRQGSVPCDYLFVIRIAWDKYCICKLAPCYDMQLLSLAWRCAHEAEQRACAMCSSLQKDPWCLRIGGT